MIKYCLACYILTKGMKGYAGRIECCNKCWIKVVGREVINLMWARAEND